MYNITNNELSSSINQPFRIKEISANRQEVRLTSGFLSKEQLKQEVEAFFPDSVTTGYYQIFT